MTPFDFVAAAIVILGALMLLGTPNKRRPR
jgi:hypothetical protein